MSTHATHANPPVPATISRVLVAVDFADSSHRAAQWAARCFVGAKLTLVHVVDVPEPPSFIGGSIPAHAELVESARRGAEARLAELRHESGARDATCIVRSGKAVAEIEQAATESQADLIVVGERGARKGASRYLGSTADRLVRMAHVPVLIVRANADHLPRTLFAAIDDRPASDNVLAWTSVLARRCKASVVLLHAIEPTISGAVRMGTAAREARKALGQLETHVKQWLESRAARLRAEHIAVESDVTFGESGVSVAREAVRADADLVIVARRGLNPLARALIGSTTQRVLRTSDRSVLIVPAEA